MAEYIQALIFTYIAFIFAVLSPGPNVLGVLNTSLEKGRVAGIFFGVGIAFGSLSWATLSVLGLTHIISKYSFLLIAIKILGGFYLLFLAYKAFNSSRDIEPFYVGSVEEVKSERYFFNGYLLMMTNPKAAMAWVAIVSLSTFSNAPFWVPISAIIGTFSLSLLIHTVYAIIFSNSAFVAFYSKSRNGILKVFSAVYGSLGIKLLASTK